MTNLGGIEKYFDLPGMLNWYPMPQPMVIEMASHVPRGDELMPLPPALFATINTGLREFTIASVNPRDAPGHGVDHAEHVTIQGLRAYDLYLQMAGEQWPVAIRQALEFALFSHDAFHCGCTFREDAFKRGTITLYPEYPLNVSVEWVTACTVNDWLQKRGVSLPMRILVMYIHWSSTFGGQSERGKQLGIPVTQPRDLCGCIMRAADVCPLATVRELLKRAIAIKYGEIPADDPPATWHEFVQGEINFLTGYVTHCFDRLDAVADKRLTHALGWRKLVASHIEELSQLQQGNRPSLSRLVRDELIQYDVVLG